MTNKNYEHMFDLNKNIRLNDGKQYDLLLTFEHSDFIILDRVGFSAEVLSMLFHFKFIAQI